MHLKVRHDTAYTFDPPRTRVVQSHRMTPNSSAAQSVLDWSIGVDGAIFGAAFIDGAGDRVSTMTLGGPVDALTITVTGEVRTTDTAGVLKGLRETIAPEVYLHETRATAPDKTIRGLAAGIQAQGLDAAHAICALVAETVAYTPGATEPDVTAAEVVDLGQGVCQDMTQVLIAIARARGMPARYVTGYMFATEDENVAEAGHAWAEVHVDGLGWVGFDPANRCCPDERYIRVGSGLDAALAAPIRGIAQGLGEERMSISVHVADQQGQSQQQNGQGQSQG